jgi:DNA-binding CsgD family transcriptional regulator
MQCTVSGSDWNSTVLQRAPFVGRHAELRQLQAAFAVARAGEGALLTVVGEPGIGKTALCEQLVLHVTTLGGQALVGHCYEEGSLSLPYMPFIEALGPYVRGREVDALRAELGTGAPHVARVISEVGERLAVELPPPANPEQDRWQLLGAVTDFLRQMALARPLLLVLEDLHDADRGTLDLLLFVARNLAGSRLLVVGTYRDVEVDRVHPLSTTLAELRRVRAFNRLPLRGLLVEDVERMLSELHVPQAGWSLAEAIQRQTEGNPLFVHELAQYLIGEGAATGQLPSNLPEGLRDVIGKRLSRLSPSANQALGAAAVIGRDFRLDVLCDLVPSPDEVLDAVLAEAIAAGVIEEQTTFGPTPTYRFTHALFRQALYEELIAPRRIRVHQQVARAMERVFGGRLDEHAAELAEHCAFSSDPTELARAVAYGQLAAQRAMAVYAYGEAELLLSRALQVQDIVDPDDLARRCDLLLELGGAMLPSDAPDRVARTVGAQAFELAEALGDSLRAARAACMALEGLWRSSGGPGGIGTPDFDEWLGRADRHAAMATPERVYAYLWKGVYAIGTGQVVEGGAYLRTALEQAMLLGDENAYRSARAFSITLLQAVRDRPMVEELALEMYAHDRVLPRIGTPTILLLDLGRILVECGDRQSAEQVWREVLHLAESTADTALMESAQFVISRQAFLDGRLEDAIAAARPLASDARARVLLMRRARSLTARALHYLGRGREVALADFASPNRTIQATRATVLGRLGECDEERRVRARFGNVGDSADESGLTVLVDLLEASVGCGDTAAVAGLYERQLPLANRLQGQNMVSIGRLLGEAAVALGRPDDARACFEQAFELCRRARFRPEVALIRLDLGSLFLTHFVRERTQAIEHVRAALEECREMGMEPCAERARELLNAISEAPDEAGGLTAREREVATLIADGMSNRQIAEALIITEGTTEVHIKHILNKLGFRSRSQVAVWATERRVRPG